MAVITLTSGWADDFYVAAVKGAILSALPDARIVDISHHIPPFNTGISHAAYIVRNSYSYFPKGTVHVLSVLSEYKEDMPFLAIHYDGHYFVGTDNGIFGLICTSLPDQMVKIEKYTDEMSPNYPAIFVFVPAAVHLAKRGNILDLGTPVVDYQHRGAILATLDESQITGTIIYINSFGNVVTNVTREDFERVGKGRPFEILVQSTRYKITRINKYFHETSRGEMLALFNISGYLEIAINKGKIASLLQLTLDSNIIIKFLPSK